VQGFQLPLREVKRTSRSQLNVGYGTDSSRSRGGPCRGAIRPIEASKTVVCYLRNTGESRSVNLDYLLFRSLSDYHSRHFRIEPANAVDANDKIRRVENVTLGEIQHGAVDLRVFSPLN
jgi:hypothetical protein